MSWGKTNGSANRFLMRPSDPRKALEYDLCTCGLVGTLETYNSWAIQHAQRCPASAALREYDAERARQAAR